MTGQIALGSGGFVPVLAEQLLEVAAAARRAATFADGEYIPQMSRADELKKSFRDAGRAATALEALKPSIAMLDGGEDGLRLAQLALDELDHGRTALREGVAVEDAFVRSGTVVSDAIATGSASAHFREADSRVRGLADLARLESLDADALLRGLLGG